MACLILKTLILKSMRLVGVLIWIRGQLIGVQIVKKDLERNDLKDYHSKLQNNPKWLCLGLLGLMCRWWDSNPRPTFQPESCSIR